MDPTPAAPTVTHRSHSPVSISTPVTDARRAAADICADLRTGVLLGTAFDRRGSSLASRDRRWFCTGLACYVAYKLIENKIGPEAALRYYDIDAQLSLYGDMKPVANLEKWTLAEDQAPEIRGIRANQANTVFAAEVIFNLTAQHGPEFISRLLAEIGKTRRDKANLKTVYRAYKHLQHEELRPYLPNAY